MSNNFYPVTSPYYNTGVVNGKFLDFMVNRSIPKIATDIYWEITTAYSLRPDMLAYDLYADSRLWWTFAARNPNRLADPFFDFVTGVGIYLPKPDTLRAALSI